MRTTWMAMAMVAAVIAVPVYGADFAAGANQLVGSARVTSDGYAIAWTTNAGRLLEDRCTTTVRVTWSQPIPGFPYWIGQAAITLDGPGGRLLDGTASLWRFGERDNGCGCSALTWTGGTLRNRLARPGGSFGVGIGSASMGFELAE